MTDLSVTLGPLTLRNPITTASGTFGYGLEFTDFVDLSAIGGLCTKGLSLKPHAGNAPPRICETPAGMLNAIGLQNVGIEAFLSDKLPKLRSLGATVIANVWGDLEDDYVTVVRALEGAQGIAAVELNISCPNVRQGGMLFGNSPPLTRSLVAKVRAATRRPLIVKLSPNAPDLVESARAAREAGADVLSLVNTFVGMAIDPETARPRISFGTGGLSGPAIRPLAVRMVYQVAKALPDVPLMGIGGIAELSDVLEFLAAGATAVQVGTANFKDPGVSARLVRELEQHCQTRGVAIKDLVRRAHRTGGRVGGEAGAEG
jgi:dihydroorotate dehydrogenase (NAD+) catalytic subunit